MSLSRTWRFLLEGSIAACWIFFPLAAYDRPDVRTILQRSVEANEKDWNAAPGYDCTERVSDSSGNKTYDVEMIDGSPYQRLVAVNGRPLSPARVDQERRKLEETIARRRSETPRERAERIAAYQRGRQQDHLLMEQLTAAMNFTLLGQRRLGPYRCYVLDATPRRGYRPPNTDSEVLTGMRGRLWIDADSYQWVRVEATVIHPVSIEGFLARVEPGTRFELEKEPVGNGVWLPQHFSMSARTRILFLMSYRRREEDWYSNYREAVSR